VQAGVQLADSKDSFVVVQLWVDDQLVKEFDATSKRVQRSVEVELSEGLHRLKLKFASDADNDTKRYSRRLVVDTMSIKGPPPIPEPYARLMKHQPSDDMSAIEAARLNLQPLIRRAYRRPPTPNDVQRVMNVVAVALEEESGFEKAVGAGLQAILVSPHFLFRVEQESSGQDLDDYALASRLSFFLWASLPDDRLLDLADSGTLKKPDVLTHEVQRMLKDPKAEALVARFFNQYLALGNLRDVEPDSARFKHWNDRLRRDIQRETEMFCREIITQDMPIETLLTGDFTFVNPRLADLYGIPFQDQDPEQLFKDGPGLYRGRVEGGRDAPYKHDQLWVRVPSPANRLGVLTHASVLTLTSNPTATSPVKRGKWILEAILGDPPPPAPPNVPTFEETQGKHAQLSLRRQLEIHRENPSCASCHNVMDPLGLGFENFDAIGRWRDRDGASEVDAAGTLADGRTFSGSVELVKLLQSRTEEINRFFAEKLLTYALGRGLEPYDNCAIDQILKRAKLQNNRFSSFVQAIVHSQPFSQRHADPDSSGEPATQ
jgi:hypothetical protein